MSVFIGFVQKLGRDSISFCEKLGSSVVFLVRVLLRNPRFARFFPLVVDQIYFVGIFSLAIILVSGLFIGMVLGLQGYNILQKFGAESQLGQLVALSVTRELGPVIAALLFVGRAGSALTAEIGLMRATEQIDCMEMMAVDTLWRIVLPRFIAGVISMPILTIVFNVIAIYGGYLIGSKWLGIDSGQFWVNMQSTVNFSGDVMNGLIKGAIFGILTTWIAVYQGYYTVPTALGISKATTKTVVYGSLAILSCDFVLTAFMLGGW